MKYLKTYEGWGSDSVIMDIREFFSNLKLISYLFKDNEKIQNLFSEVSNAIELRKPMSFFGFVNDSETSFHPIVDTVTSKLHSIFFMIQRDDYNAIYNWCNSERSEYNYFEKDSKLGIYSTLKNHMSNEIAKALYYVKSYNFKPYMDIKFWNSGYNKKEETNELIKKVDKIIKKSDLNKDYNIKVYSSENAIEIRLISKNPIKLNNEQLSEIEKAKEFGEKKYEYLQHRIDNKELYDRSNKYNL